MPRLRVPVPVRRRRHETAFAAQQRALGTRFGRGVVAGEDRQLVGRGELRRVGTSGTTPAWFRASMSSGTPATYTGG